MERGPFPVFCRSFPSWVVGNLWWPPSGALLLPSLPEAAVIIVTFPWHDITLPRFISPIFLPAILWLTDILTTKPLWTVVFLKFTFLEPLLLARKELPPHLFLARNIVLCLVLIWCYETNLFPSYSIYTQVCRLASTCQTQCWRTHVTQKSQTGNPTTTGCSGNLAVIPLVKRLRLLPGV